MFTVQQFTITCNRSKHSRLVSTYVCFSYPCFRKFTEGVTSVLRTDMNLFTPAKNMGERMIMAVFRRPVLWNMRIDIYRDKNKTNQAWKEIGEEFGLPGTLIKTLIKRRRK